MRKSLQTPQPTFAKKNSMYLLNKKKQESLKSVVSKTAANGFQVKSIDLKNNMRLSSYSTTQGGISKQDILYAIPENKDLN